MRIIIYILLFFSTCSNAQVAGVIKEQVPIDITNALIMCHGNSLTAATNGQTSYPTQLSALSGISGVVKNVVNNGVGGATTQDMIDGAPTTVDNWLVDPYRGTINIVVAWEIGNDIYENGSVDGAKARWQEYCEDRKAAGWDYVIVVTLPPRNQSTSHGDNVTVFNTKLSSANSWLRTSYIAYSDGVADVRADSRLQDYDNTTYFLDGVHLTTAGYAVVAEIIKDAILALTTIE